MQSAFDEIPGFASTRLLLVDDNPKLCRMVKEYLEPVGYEVAVAHTEPEGLRKALEGDFHAIILDVMLPGPDGFEVLRTSMERSKALVSVVVRDSEGSQRAAEVIFASPNQVNFVVPGGTAPGAATVTISSGEGWELTGDMFVQTVAPALFTANATGSGVAALWSCIPAATAPAQSS